MMSSLADITAVIKTFRRPTCLASAVDCLSSNWPSLGAVIVLDDGPPESQVPFDSRYRLIRTEENIGLSEGRNRLIDAVETPLVLVLDDDFQAGREARLDLLGGLVRSDHCEIAGAAIREIEGFWNGGWCYSFENGGRLQKFHAAHRCERPMVNGEPTNVYYVDQVNNAFVAKTDFLRRVRWDSRLKLREHDDFALRSSRAGRIVYTPNSVIDHVPYDPPGYRTFRYDTEHFYSLFLEKWGLAGVVKEIGWGVHSSEVPHPRPLT